LDTDRVFSHSYVQYLFLNVVHSVMYAECKTPALKYNLAFEFASSIFAQAVVRKYEF